MGVHLDSGGLEIKAARVGPAPDGYEYAIEPVEPILHCPLVSFDPLSSPPTPAPACSDVRRRRSPRAAARGCAPDLARRRQDASRIPPASPCPPTPRGPSRTPARRSHAHDEQRLRGYRRSPVHTLRSRSEPSDLNAESGTASVGTRRQDRVPESEEAGVRPLQPDPVGISKITRAATSASPVFIPRLTSPSVSLLIPGPSSSRPASRSICGWPK